MRHRTMDEMISYFNQEVSKMDIDQSYKMALLGMICAIGVENDRQERKWIPVTERLPEHDFTDVLVCMRDMHKGCEDDYYFVSAYIVRGQWKQTLRIADDLSDLKVIAWMPCPEPYREENNELGNS